MTKEEKLVTIKERLEETMLFELQLALFGICRIIGSATMFILTFVWTLPNTLIGLFNGFLFTLSMPKWKHGCLVFASGRGLSKIMRMFARAVTFGYVVICWEEDGPNDNALMVHEKHHVWQYKILGPLFLPIYFVFLIFSKGSQGPEHFLEKTAYRKGDEYISGHSVVKGDTLHDILHGALGLILVCSTSIYLIFFI